MPDVKDLSIEDEPKQEAGEEVSASPEAEKPAPLSTPPSKGRVIFIYSCPGGSPVKLRMVYSTSVRGVQQDAADKAGVDIVGKVSHTQALHYQLRTTIDTCQLETSDIPELTESHLRSALPANKPKHASSLPTPSSSASGGSSFPKANTSAFGAPAPAFGGAFGRPRPIVPKKENSVSSINTASQVPLPNSAPSTPADSAVDEGDGKEGIRRAFDAFGPRVGGGGGGGGFARPKPAGRR